jgi:hypothetical protein
MSLSRSKRIALVSGVSALALGAMLVAWASRGPERASQRPGAGAAAALGRHQPRHPREQEVIALARRRDPDAGRKLVELYLSLAADPSATNVRRLALGALFAEPSLGLRLKQVLDAVAADSTPARQDPLYPEITKRLAEQWKPGVFDKGRDLMLMEKRPRAQRALVGSFVDFVGSGQADSLGPDQRSALLTDLIDMHALVAPDQRPEIQEAVRRLGGNDPADLLAGRGLTQADKLELQQEYERQLQAAIKALVKDPPN